MAIDNWWANVMPAPPRPTYTPPTSWMDPAAGFGSLLGSSSPYFTPPPAPAPAPAPAAMSAPAPAPVGAPAFAPVSGYNLSGDPLYQQALADYNAAGVTDAATRAAARQRAIVQFGEVPNFAQDAGAMGLVGGNFQQDITAKIAALAGENTSAGLSTVARLGVSHADNIRNLVNALAGRGILHSGETGWQLGRDQTAFTQAQYDSRQKLLDYLGGVQSAFSSAEAARLSALRAAQYAAAQQAAQYGYGTGTAAAPAPSQSAPAPSPYTPSPYMTPFPVQLTGTLPAPTPYATPTPVYSMPGAGYPGGK